MNKLLQYLNEYEKEISQFPVPWSYTRGMLQYGSFIPQVSITYAISHKYGFIKWLVGKDRINRNETLDYGINDGGLYGEALYNLAIQDNPTAFLSFIIK